MNTDDTVITGEKNDLISMIQTINVLIAAAEHGQKSGVYSLEDASKIMIAINDIKSKVDEITSKGDKQD